MDPLLTYSRQCRWYGGNGDDGVPALALRNEADALWRELLGDLRASPEASLRQLMDDLMPQSMRRDGVTAWPSVARHSASVSDLSWVRALSDDERVRPWVHSYDKNAMYLTACSSVELGLGDVAEEAVNEIAFDRRLPGYWRADDAWGTTPLLALAEDRGLVMPPFDGAFVWQRHGRALTPWYNRLRQARAHWMELDTPAARLALRCLKRGYTRAIGWLDGYWFAERGQLDSPAYRPDWRHMIIATAAANMARTIDRCEGAIVACHIDNVFIVSDCTDPAEAAPPALTLGTGLGQFKHRASCPLGLVWELFTPTTPAGQLDKAVRACQR